MQVRGQCHRKQKLLLPLQHVNYDTLLAHFKFAKTFGPQVREFRFNLECTKKVLMQQILKKMTSLETLKIIEERETFLARETNLAIFRDPLPSVKIFKIAGGHFQNAENVLTENIALAILSLCPNAEEIAVGKPARVFCELIAKDENKLAKLKALDVGLLTDNVVNLEGLLQLNIPLRKLHLEIWPCRVNSGIILSQLLKKFTSTLVQVEIIARYADKRENTVQVTVPNMKMLKTLYLRYDTFSFHDWLAGVRLVAETDTLPKLLPNLRQLGLTITTTGRKYPTTSASAQAMFQRIRPQYEAFFLAEEKWYSVKRLDVVYPLCRHDIPRENKDMRLCNLGEYTEFYNRIFSCVPNARVEEFRPRI